MGPAPSRGRADTPHTTGWQPASVRDRVHRGPRWPGWHRGPADAQTGHTADITGDMQRTWQSTRHVSSDPNTPCACVVVDVDGPGQPRWARCAAAVGGCCSCCSMVGMCVLSPRPASMHLLVTNVHSLPNAESKAPAALQCACRTSPGAHGRACGLG